MGNRLFDLHLDNRRISPDPESEQVIPNLRDPRAESCRYFAIGKTVDRSILRPETRDSPGSLSTGGTPLRKTSKYSDPHDTKQLFGKVLGESQSLAGFFSSSFLGVCFWNSLVYSFV